ncbi:uncharacterized protein V1516DRAFT_472595 [Lipomyces oligophaga]|uniref:uncharacterized protein n=1 Tax=Lipomyces oligophaga TaxID=45792 RepID=UPI0034CFD0A3
MDEDEIVRLFKIAIQQSDLTVETLNSIRRTVAKDCGLEEDFFRSAAWKQRSADLADEALAEMDSKPKRKKRSRRASGSSEHSTATKRHKTKQNPRYQKLGQVDFPDPILEQNEDEDVENDEDGNEKVKENEDGDGEQRDRDRVMIDPEDNLRFDNQQIGDELVDKDPLGNRSKYNNDYNIEANPTPPLRRRSKKDTKANDNAIEQKITSLKSWIVQCGVRKVWARELAPYPTGKEQIEHLTNLLEELGMKPRYSKAKAKKIKEDRALQSEVEQLHLDTAKLQTHDRTRTQTGGKVTVESSTGMVSDKVDLSGFITKNKTSTFNADFLADQSDSD